MITQKPVSIIERVAIKYLWHYLKYFYSLRVLPAASRINTVPMFWRYSFDFQNYVFPKGGVAFGVALGMSCLLVKVKLYVLFSGNDS